MNWIIENKEWLFSGISIIIIGSVIKYFSKNKEKNITILTENKNENNNENKVDVNINIDATERNYNTSVENTIGKNDI